MLCRLILIIILLPLSAFCAKRAVTPVIENPADFYTVSAALVIGEYDYSGGWPKLPGVKQDVQAVGDALSAHGFKVSRLNNHDKASVISGVEGFLKKYGGDSRSRILIYYAGHGHTLNENGRKKGFVVLKNAKEPSKDLQGFKKEALEIDYFTDKMKNLNSKHALFVFDSCFSGTLLSSMRSVPDFVLDMLKKPAREFLASGTEDQQVPDESVFRRRFIDGINGQADSNQDGLVTGSELGMFVQTSVSDFSKGTQTPVFGKLKESEGEFLFFASEKDSGNADAKQPEGSEKERLLAVIKKAPGSPEANEALKRLREIDESLKNLPPVEQKERKDFVMTAVSKKITKYTDTDYPYVVIAPVTAAAGGKNIMAAFRVKAKDNSTYRLLNQRKEMLASVMGNKIEDAQLKPGDSMAAVREEIKTAAKNALDFACPQCSAEAPALIGLKIK